MKRKIIIHVEVEVSQEGYDKLHKDKSVNPQEEFEKDLEVMREEEGVLSVSGELKIEEL